MSWQSWRSTVTCRRFGCIEVLGFITCLIAGQGLAAEPLFSANFTNSCGTVMDIVCIIFVRMVPPLWRLCSSLLLSWVVSGAFGQGALPGTEMLSIEGDVSAQMVAGIGRFLERETA